MEYNSIISSNHVIPYCELQIHGSIHVYHQNRCIGIVIPLKIIIYIYIYIFFFFFKSGKYFIERKNYYKGGYNFLYSFQYLFIFLSNHYQCIEHALSFSDATMKEQFALVLQIRLFKNNFMGSTCEVQLSENHEI